MAHVDFNGFAEILLNYQFAVQGRKLRQIPIPLIFVDNASASSTAFSGSGAHIIVQATSFFFELDSNSGVLIILGVAPSSINNGLYHYLVSQTLDLNTLYDFDINVQAGASVYPRGYSCDCIFYT